MTHFKKICRVSILTLCAFITFSCTNDLAVSNGTEDLVIYPPPPDTTRVQYLTSISTSTDIKGEQSAFNKFVFGEEIPKPIVKPYGLCVSDSVIYVCDTGLGGIVLIDIIKNNFEYFTPAGRGQLQLPLNCSVDNKGYLYIADGNRSQIVVFDRNKKYVSEFGEEGETFRPTDVAVSGSKAFVVSVKDQRVFVYDKNTNSLLYSFPDMDPEDDGYLFQPTSLTLDDNFLYVSDVGDNKVKVYTHDGSYVRSVGETGTYAGQLTRPKGVAVDENSNLYIVDAAFENVQIFNKEGNVLMFFGGPYSKHGDMWLPADVTISYSGLDYFRKFVDPGFTLKYLIYVTNQYGPDKVNVYGFVGPK